LYWRKLLQKLLIPEPQIRLSGKVLSAFVRKFTKRRCATYLARDGLALKHEEDESAMRQMLKKFNDKSDEEKTSKAESNAINKVTGHLNALRGMNQSGWLTKSVFHVIHL